MVCNATFVVNFEAHKAPCHAMVIGMGAVAIVAGRVSIEDAGAGVIRGGNRRRGRLGGSELVLELLDTLLEALGVGQSWVAVACE